VSVYREQIERAVQATVVRSPFTFSWFGQPSRPPNPAVRDTMSASDARRFLQGALQRRLYSDFYLSGEAIAWRRGRTALPGPDARSFVAGLSVANCGQGSWSTGWTEVSAGDGQVVVHDERLGLDLWLAPGDVRRAGHDAVEIRIPAAWPDWSPGFWIALGDVPFGAPDEPRTRFYWNLLADGAVHLVERATRLLNGAAIPFQLKLLSDPSRYTRCDAAVLYLPEPAVDPALPLIRAIHNDVRPWLRSAVPALTLRLAPGLALADDPGREQSFGASRCRLLASGVVASAEAGARLLPDRLAIVLDHLAAAGIDIDRPYLRPGARDRRLPDIAFTPVSDQNRPASLPPQADHAAIAAQIAEEIVAGTLWHGQECVWLGTTEAVERGRPVFGTLGPSLYAGAAGIALFLGDVHAVTGDVACRAAALGGIRHALAHAGDIPEPARLGLYTGLPGIAVAAARLAQTLDEPSLLDDALALLATIDQTPARERDLLSGTAGALIALLLLYAATADDDTLIDRAIQLGDQLLEAAWRGTSGSSWRSGRRALTGLSHGASGIAVALLELAAVSGETRFQDAALAAFAWERRLFDAGEGNWPDLRRVHGPFRRSVRLPFGTSWCHGAPGIALSRLRAAELLDDDQLAAEARVALETTRRAVERGLAERDASFCLCHGLAGNAEILLDGFQAFGDTALRDAATVVAQAGAERHAASPDSWPSGTFAGQTPGLMLGLAGIGRFYLRLARPELPSILLPVRL
jgi:hypothetical protein